MNPDPSDRSARIARLIEGQSIDELRRTTLQAIDHAYKSAAEVAQAYAMFEGAQGTIAELKDENRRLHETLRALDSRSPGLSSRARRSAAVAADQARSRRRKPAAS